MKTGSMAFLILLFSVCGFAAGNGPTRFSFVPLLNAKSVSGSQLVAPARLAPLSETNRPVYAGFDLDVDPTGITFVAGVEIDSSFQSNGWLAKYDQRQVLQSSVIFPQGAFYRIARDFLGNIYVAGRIEKEVETDFGPRSDADILVVKYDSSLNLIRSQIIEGVNSGGYDDGANDLAFGPNGDLIVVGFIEKDYGHKIAWLGKFDSDFNVTQNIYDPPEILSSEGNSVIIDAQGIVFIAAEVIPSPTNYESTNGSTYILKYDDAFHLLGSVEVVQQVGISYEPVRIITDKIGDFVLFGEKWNNGNLSMWIGRVSSNFSEIKIVEIDPSPLDDAPRDMDLDGEGNIYVAAMINIGEEGSDKSLGWVARYSASLIQQSSFTISGNDPQGQNGAFGLKIDNKALYVTGVLTHTDGTVSFLKKSVLADTLDLSDPLSENVNEARGYPSLFQPSKGHTGITFDRMPLDSMIRIYSTTGKLVREVRVLTGVYLWNVKNDGGEDMSSGVYLVRVSGSGGDKTFKIVVQR